MAEELTQDEIARLKNMEAFNASIAATGWQVSGKVIRENLAGIRLRNSVFEKVQFEGVRWRGAEISNTRFTGCEFTVTDFGGAKLTGVEFTDCVFANCVMNGAELVQCRFTRCKSENLKAREARFTKCEFDSYQDRNVVFGGSQLRECTFVASRLENPSFQVAVLERVVFRRSALRLAVFGEITGSNLLFEDTILHKSGFVDSTYGNLGMERCTVRGVTFDQFGLERVILRNSPSVAALTVERSDWKNTMIADCGQVTELTWTRSRLANWQLVRSMVAYLRVRECELSGEPVIADCEIAGLSMAGTRATGLRMERTVLHESVELQGAVFDGLRLSGVRYAEGLRVDGRAEYRNSEGRFPE
jgi:uncharacterized protein YjbI with pentapeptide repeats